MNSRGHETATLPTLYYPFSPVINPHADTIHENTLVWLSRFDVFRDELAYNDFILHT